MEGLGPQRPPRPGMGLARRDCLKTWVVEVHFMDAILQGAWGDLPSPFRGEF